MEKEFLRAYDAWADPIFRHALLRLSDRERAKDIVQESFTRTWKSLAEGEEIKNIKAFLYKIANNLIVDEYRRRASRTSISLEELREIGKEPKSRADLQMRNQSEVTRLLSLLDRLEPLYRDVLTLRFVDDLRPKEIAEVLGESKNVISVRIHRGIKQLQELIQPRHAVEDKKTI